MTSGGEGEPIKVPHVQRIRRGDKVHLYFRKGDYREGPLQAADGTQALAGEVAAILARLAAAETAQARARPGSLTGALKLYNRSPEFLALARTTQSAYQDVIDELIEDCGGWPVSDVTRAWAAEMRDAWALRGHRVANVRLSILANALAPAIEDGRLDHDPFSRLKRARRPRDAGEANPAWTDTEVANAIADALRNGLPGLARAYALGRWGGFRRGTICAIPPHARVQGRDAEGQPQRRLYWITEKRRVLCDKREDPRLTDLLARTADATPAAIAYNAAGRPWKPRQLNQAMDRHLARLAKAGLVRAAREGDEVWSPLTIHGLRHARGVELAHAGASDAEIMAQLEHATPRMAQEYRRQADRRHLADAGQDRIDNVVALRAKRAKAAGNPA
ncbi:MAG: site-specific integrase [Proteobacteria bacterium]|nr:site-specific integrase [Pseudomonadota bacterium]